MISYRTVREFVDEHPPAREALGRWYELAAGANWATLADVGRDFPHCDLATVRSGRSVQVFNVGGNKYRVIAAIHFNRGVVYILFVRTHKQYDAERWKQEF